MQNISKTGIGAIITVLITIGSLFGIQLPDGAGGDLTEAVSTVVGLVLIVWGQLSRKDLVGGLIRK